MIRIAIFGGSFNPPGIHHRRMAERLLERFDELVIVPCGPRPDKEGVAEIEPIHRAAMVDLAFGALPRTEVDLFDLEQDVFTRTWELQERYQHRGEVWHVVGADLVEGGRAGNAPIQRHWHRGGELWQDGRFAVFARPGYRVEADHDLPPRCELFEVEFEGASSTTRERIFWQHDAGDSVSEEIGAYIARYRLYRSALPQRSTRLILPELRPRLVVDADNPEALRLAEECRRLASGGPERANCILVIGGDGTMLRAIRESWRARLPLVGLNAGHRGFLLNNPEYLFREEGLITELIVQHLPLLYVEAELDGNEPRSSIAFNDAWVERSTSQTAWIEVSVDGVVRLPRLVSDGILVATAAGSTAYARAMGATPLRVDTPELLLVGSNVTHPPGWKSAHLSLDAEIEIRTLEPTYRPVVGFVDGESFGPVTAFRVRRSRIAAVELAFAPDRDLTTKLTEIQFP